MSICEHDVVVLTRDLPDYNLHAGDVGAVVHIYENGAAYEVEFVDGVGKTLALETLDATAVRPRGEGEILHIRNIAAA